MQTKEAMLVQTALAGAGASMEKVALPYGIHGTMEWLDKFKYGPHYQEALEIAKDSMDLEDEREKIYRRDRSGPPAGQRLSPVQEAKIDVAHRKLDKKRDKLDARKMKLLRKHIKEQLDAEKARNARSKLRSGLAKTVR